MYVARLQLKGFKSFGGSHDLILSPGFTAIVGPNGSGKSNLLDALRWALGETSASQLRIKQQINLLFDGSMSKEAAKEAEVSLSLRDGERVCRIKRRVAAPDGTTALFVDGGRKTLAELNDIKRLWKLEGVKFAFIGQGEVQAMLEQSPLQRRGHFEVLFGVDAYRKKRTDSQEKLAEAKAEYDQLRHLANELSARRDEIAPEVRRATEVRAALDTIEDDRRILYWLRREDCEKRIEGLALEIEKASGASQGTLFWSRFWKNASDAAERKSAGASRTHKEKSSELEQCRERFSELTKRGYASAMNLRAAASRMKDAGKELEEGRKRYAVLSDEQKKSASKNKKTREELEKARAAFEATEKKWEEYNERLENTKHKREEWNKERARIDGETEQCRAKLSYLGRELLELRGKKEETPLAREELEAQRVRFEAQRARLEAEQEKLAKEHEGLYLLTQKLAAETQRAKRETANLRARLNEANDALQSGHYPVAVNHLLSAAKLNRLKASPRAVIDAISAPENLAAALEAYLGGRQFQLLVENMEEAGRCIDMLKANSAGTATFLPLERARPRFPDKSFRLPAAGVVGWAIELISVEKHWEPAVQHILGDLLIVRSFDVGKELVRAGFRGPIASADGDVFQPGGTVSGGRTKRSGRILEMKAQTARLEKEYKAAALAAEELSKKSKEAEEKELAASEGKEEYTRRIREINGKIAVIEDKAETLAKERKRAAGERGRIIDAIKAEGQTWKKLREEAAALEEKRDADSDVEDDRKLVEEREARRAAVKIAESAVTEGFALMNRISGEAKSQEARLVKLEEEIAELDATRVRERSNLARVGGSCLEIHNRKKELMSELEKHGGEYAKLDALKVFIAKRGKTAEEKSLGEAQKLSAAKNKKDEAERERTELIATWDERFPYDAKRDFPREATVDELRRRISAGEKKIKAFGDVDMGALSEDQNLKERLAFLGGQLDDVRTSASRIEKMIAEADAMATSQFTAALQRVDERFCSLFKILFGGGEAHLAMTEGETIWNVGVEIDARLPGKHTKVLNQYSGGERSLISISLLFATMEVADSPIAVLDEVDAALDESNLRRFSELTKEYAKTRQILAMTHRRATMERADVLYGVTLREQGLSQVVGVRLEDWS